MCRCKTYPPGAEAKPLITWFELASEPKLLTSFFARETCIIMRECMPMSMLVGKPVVGKRPAMQSLYFLPLASQDLHLL